MNVYLTKSSRFESTNFAYDMIDDVGFTRTHQFSQCDQHTTNVLRVNTSLLGECLRNVYVTNIIGIWILVYSLLK